MMSNYKKSFSYRSNFDNKSGKRSFTKELLGQNILQYVKLETPKADFELFRNNRMAIMEIIQEHYKDTVRLEEEQRSKLYDSLCLFFAGASLAEGIVSEDREQTQLWFRNLIRCAGGELSDQYRLPESEDLLEQVEHGFRKLLEAGTEVGEAWDIVSAFCVPEAQGFPAIRSVRIRVLGAMGERPNAQGMIGTLRLEWFPDTHRKQVRLQRHPDTFLLPLDAEFERSLNDVLQWAQFQKWGSNKRGVVRWRLEMETDAFPAATGKSIGLPWAVGLNLLWEGGDFDDSIALTGEITEGGAVKWVDFIQEKLTAARKHGMALVLLPQDLRDLDEMEVDSDRDRYVRVGYVTEAILAYKNKPITRLVTDAYLEAIIKSFEFVPKPIFVNGRPIPVPLNKVFISLFPSPGNTSEITTSAEQTDEFGATIDPEVFERINSASTFTPPKSSKSLDEVMGDELYTLIMGDPGTGKTTLLWQHAVSQARARLKPGGANAPIPIFITASDFAAYADQALQQHGHRATLFEFLGRQPLEFQPLYPGSHYTEPRPIAGEVLNNTLWRELKRCGGVILIDGLDEVGDERRRRAISGQINAFVEFLASDQDAKKIKVLVTSRIVGYQLAPLQSDILRFTIQPLDRSAIQELSRNLFQIIKGSDEEGAAAASDFLDQLLAPRNERLRSIVENPFLLTLVCTTYCEQNRFPANRVDLYRSVVDDNLFAKLKEKGVGTSLESVLNIINAMAFEIHQSPNSRAGKARFIELLKQNICEEKEYLQGEEARLIPSAGDLFDLLTHSSGLMVEKGPQEFAFSHRSLQEYLAGRHFFRQMNQKERRLSASDFVAYSKDARWREPVSFALGYAASLQESYGQDWFEDFVRSILEVDAEGESEIPDASLLLARAYFEIDKFPVSILCKMLGNLLKRYCNASTVGGRFRRIVEDFVSTIWGQSGDGFDAELEVEDRCVALLEGEDPLAALRAAELIHKRRLYSRSIADALVTAQRHDSAATDWFIHRALQVLVTRLAIETIFDFKPTPSDADRLPESSEMAEAFRRVKKGILLKPAGSERGKMRKNLKRIKLPQLGFRSELLRRPELAVRIAESAEWSKYIAQLGIGGFGDFETKELRKLQTELVARCTLKLGSDTERQQWAVHLDTYLMPLLRSIKKSYETVTFKAEWIIRDPDDYQGLLLRLAAGQPPPHIAAEPRAFYINGDARVRAGEAQFSRDDNLFDFGLILMNGLFDSSRDAVYNWAVILDTIGADLTKNLEGLVKSAGKAGLALLHPSFGIKLSELIWEPRPDRLDDFFVLALDILEKLEPAAGFVHTWFLMQMQPILETDGALAWFRVEALARVLRHRRNDATYKEALAAVPETLRSLSDRTFLQELLVQAELIPDPYARARAYIALYNASPRQFPELPRRSEELLEAIQNPLDRGIIAVLLSYLPINASRALELRQSAIAEVGVDSRGTELFRGSVEGADLGRIVSRMFPPSQEKPGVSAISTIASEDYQSGAELSDDSAIVWRRIERNPERGWEEVLRHVTQGWLEMTLASRDIYRRLSPDLRRKILPFLKMADERLLEEFVLESSDFTIQMSLIAAENQRWSPVIVRNVVGLLNSKQDLWRLRAQYAVSAAERTLNVSRLDEATLLEMASCYQREPERIAIFWLLTGLVWDTPDLLAEFCSRIDRNDPDTRIFLLVSLCHRITEPAWQVMLHWLRHGGTGTQSALLSALRSIAEGGLPKFALPEDLHAALHQILDQFIDQATDETFAAKAIEIIGFLPKNVLSPLFNLRLLSLTNSTLAYSAALVTAGRQGERADSFVHLLENQEADIRTAAHAALALQNIVRWADYLLEDAIRRDHIRGLVAACKGRYANQTYFKSLELAAKFVMECWDHGDTVPLNELMSMVESFLIGLNDKRIRIGRGIWHYELVDKREALAVAGVIAQMMPERFARVVTARRDVWEPSLVDIATEYPGFIHRAAALEILGLIPQAEVETIEAILSGLNDVPFVAQVANDVSSRLRRLTKGARRKLCELLEGESCLTVVSAAGILAKAIESAKDREEEKSMRELRQNFSDQLDHLMKSDTVKIPLVRMLLTNDWTYTFRFGQTLEGELSGLQFQLQAAQLPDRPEEIQSRDVLDRVSLMAPGVEPALQFQRIEIGEIVTTDIPWEQQIKNSSLAPGVETALTQLVTVCREQGYSFVEMIRVLLNSSL